MQKRSLVLLAGTLISASVAMAADFPAGATAPDAQTIRAHMADKNFNMSPGDGHVWRLDYKSNGYLFFASGAYTESGTWSVEDGKLCTAMQKSGNPSCNDVRLLDGVLYLKRNNGDIVKFEPR